MPGRKETRYMCLPVKAVYGGYRKQVSDDALPLLAASIAKHGLLQPIVVRCASAHCYQLVLGSRRLEACRLLGMTHIDAIVIDAQDHEALCCALEEEHTRKAVHFLDEADAIRRIGSVRLCRHGILPSAFFRERLRYAELGERICALIRRAELSMEQTAALFSVRDEERCLEAASIIADRGLTPYQARRLILGAEKRGNPPLACSEVTPPSEGRKRRRRREKMIL